MRSTNTQAEDSGLYLYLPISFNISNYRLFLEDGGRACCTYGAYPLSTNKIRVYNIGFNPDGSVNSVNNSSYGVIVFAIGS